MDIEENRTTEVKPHDKIAALIYELVCKGDFALKRALLLLNKHPHRSLLWQ
jgi:hypothetical protein